MGKKSRKTRTGNTNKVDLKNDRDLPIDFQNPDGSSVMMAKEETPWIGGRTIHMGETANGAVDAFRLSERQLQNVQGMFDSYHRKYGSDADDANASPITEAALKLEYDLTFNSDPPARNRQGLTKVQRKELNDSVVMSTHRWFITVLSIELVEQISAVAQIYREAFKSYQTLWTNPVPSANLIFGGIKGVVDNNHKDVVDLMNALLAVPYGVDVYVYSESSKDIYCCMKEFVRSPEGLLKLPLDASADEILEYVHDQAGMLDSACCYWCEKNKLSAKRLFVCSRCKSVSYCSAECQKNDWKPFHKAECQKITEGGMTKKQLGMEISRCATLKKPGVQFPQMPIVIAQKTETDHAFRGDVLAGYVTNMNLATMALDEKCKLFPYGMHISPREYGQYEQLFA